MDGPCYNQYLFGSDMLVAPLLEEGNSRDIYLPPGEWIDYQTGETYSTGWHHIEAGEIPIVIMVRDGSVIPHIKLAQSTRFMDWSELELKVYAVSATAVTGKLCLPSEDVLKEITLIKDGNQFRIHGDPYNGRVGYKITYRD